jgi:DNA-binding NarL/FixJ family response regulator
MKPEISIIIADDHPIFRQGLRHIIETDAALQIVAEASDGEAALAQIEQTRARIAILDVNMPRKDGFEVLRAVQERRLPTAIIFLTMHNDEKYFNTALDAGVKGYVLKDGASTEIINCIRAVAAGQNYISPPLSTYLINRSRRADALAQSIPALESLTPTERRVLKLLAQYKTSQEIADELCISVRTVHHHRANIAEKLELRGSHALMKFAIEHQSEL